MGRLGLRNKTHDPPLYAFPETYRSETHMSFLPGSYSYLLGYPFVKPLSGTEYRTDGIQGKLYSTTRNAITVNARLKRIFEVSLLS